MRRRLDRPCGPRDALAALGRRDEREAELARAIDRGADMAFVTRLAVERSRAGRWAEAVSLYDRAIAMGPVSMEVWTEAAIAHVEIGDEAGYRRVCEILRGRHPANIQELPLRSNLAVVLAMAPGGVGRDGKALAWIEPAAAAAFPGRRDIKRQFLLLLGACTSASADPARRSARSSRRS